MMVVFIIKESDLKFEIDTEGILTPIRTHSQAWYLGMWIGLRYRYNLNQTRLRLPIKYQRSVQYVVKRYSLKTSIDTKRICIYGLNSTEWIRILDSYAGIPLHQLHGSIYDVRVPIVNLYIRGYLYVNLHAKGSKLWIPGDATLLSIIKETLAEYGYTLHCVPRILGSKAWLHTDVAKFLAAMEGIRYI